MISFLKNWLKKESVKINIIRVVNTALRTNNKSKLVRGFEGWLQYELAMVLREAGLLGEGDIEPRLEKKDGKHVWADLRIKNGSCFDLAVFDKSDRNSIEKDYIQRYKNLVNNENVFILIFYFYDKIDESQYNDFVRKNALNEIKDIYTIEDSNKEWFLKVLHMTM